MVHEYCKENNLKDIKSNKHSETFCNECLNHGLNCEEDEKLGWAITSLNKETIDFLENYDGDNFFDEFKNDFWFRQEPEKEKPRKSQFKYT